MLLVGVGQWFNRQTLRERIAVMFCALVMMAAPAYFLVLEPAGRSETETRRQIERLSSELTDLETQRQLMLQPARTDPDQELRERLAYLERQLDEQRTRLQQGLSHLVAPADMPELLKQLLERQRNLHLLQLETLTPERIGATNAPAGSEPSSVLYRHRLQMDMQGDYLSVLDYLRRLQELPRVVVVDEVAILTEEYPTAKIRLRVYTLGLTEDWLGG